MTNNITGMVLLFLLLIFWVKPTGCSSEFHVVFEHFQDLKNFILNTLKEKLTFKKKNLSPRKFFFTLKWYKRFRTAECKQR